MTSTQCSLEPETTFLVGKFKHGIVVHLPKPEGTIFGFVDRLPKLRAHSDDATSILHVGALPLWIISSSRSNNEIFDGG